MCDSSGMANIQLLRPCHILSGQSVTAGRRQGDPDKSGYQSSERLSKYSNGGQGKQQEQWGEKEILKFKYSCWFVQTLFSLSVELFTHNIRFTNKI